MLLTLLAALALSSSLSADVPFLSQTPDLCGGAAVAMVFRYWGDAHADIQQFVPLVDRKAGGITDEVLVEAVRARGWQALAFTGTVESLGEHVQNRRPIIVLLHDRGRLYHYVVVTAVEGKEVTVHDPSWGPSRVIQVDDFERRWSAARFWSLMIVPGLTSVRLKPDATETSVPLKSDAADADSHLHRSETLPVVSDFGRTERARCDALLDDAIAEVQQRGLQDADAILGRVRATCPASAGPLRELAGARFAERRWSEAAALAREALALDNHDTYAIDLLGSSLFMLDDPAGALRAWNRIGKPRLDSLRIEGLHHARYETIAAVVAVRTNAMLTPEAFALAERRVNALPDRSSARLTLRPDTDGFATLDAVIAERATVPRGARSWAGLGLQAAVDREATVSLPGFTGQGDVWSATWRWWEHRPRVALGLAAPRVAGLPGVWRVDASWEQETYGVGSIEAPVLVTQSHTHGGLAVSDWLTSNLRYSVGGGFDAWDSNRKAGSIGASLERRLLADRVSLAADATTWLPVGGGAAFHAVGARLIAQSPMQSRNLAYATGLGIERVSDDAPLGLWPGAGDGHARTPLLRAHPLLDAGIIDATTRSAFGRTLTYGNAEVQRWLDRPALIRMGVAAFADAAVARRGGADARGSSNVDVGAGVRLKLPARDRVLRIDLAHGVADGANALTIGWLF